MTRTFVLIGDLWDEESLRLYYCNGCNPVSDNAAVFNWIQDRSVDEIEQRLVRERMTLAAQGKDAYNRILGDILIWADNFLFISVSKKGEIEYIRAMTDWSYPE